MVIKPLKNTPDITPLDIGKSVYRKKKNCESAFRSRKKKAMKLKFLQEKKKKIELETAQLRNKIEDLRAENVTLYNDKMLHIAEVTANTFLV